MSDTNTPAPMPSLPPEIPGHKGDFTSLDRSSTGEEEYVEDKPLSVLMVAGISAFVALVVLVAGLAMYHSFFAQRTKVGVVDIPGILEISELIFTDQLSQPNLTDADRAKAYELVKDTGTKIQASMDEILETCGCVLMTKAAVIGGTSIDYTGEVKKSLGSDNVDVRVLQQRMMDIMTGKIPGSIPTAANTPAPMNQPAVPTIPGNSAATPSLN